MLRANTVPSSSHPPGQDAATPAPAASVCLEPALGITQRESSILSVIQVTIAQPSPAIPRGTDPNTTEASRSSSSRVVAAEIDELPAINVVERSRDILCDVATTTNDGVLSTTIPVPHDFSQTFSLNCDEAYKYCFNDYQTTQITLIEHLKNGGGQDDECDKDRK
ncbi:hypothetical protein NM208_g4906 [Fusarium decemcellulare]|uniref:Uncharacterized protein n=1 Tax=Fusarium decemcellulare TaxID=57161 RepID=A0ACC1SJB5_9HYPO|nr:hypothetical protein NM208_g4906 [Fusarium decemcellulare]